MTTIRTEIPITWENYGTIEPAEKKIKVEQLEIPEEIYMQIFLVIHPTSIFSILSTCKRWNIIMKKLADPINYFPNLRVIDGSRWKMYPGFNSEEYPTVNKLLAISTLNEFYTKAKEETPVTLLMMPKGLDVEKLMTLLDYNGTPLSIRRGLGIDFDKRRIYESLNSLVEKTHWVVISGVFISQTELGLKPSSETPSTLLQCSKANPSFFQRSGFFNTLDERVHEDRKEYIETIGNGWKPAAFLPALTLKIIGLIIARDKLAKVGRELIITKKIDNSTFGSHYFPRILCKDEKIDLCLADETCLFDAGLLAQKTLVSSIDENVDRADPQEN